MTWVELGRDQLVLLLYAIRLTNIYLRSEGVLEISSNERLISFSGTLVLWFRKCFFSAVIWSPYVKQFHG